MRIPGSERALTALGYLPVLAWVLLLFKVRRDSLFVQFHLRQSALLNALWFGLALLIIILLVPLGDVYAAQLTLFGILAVATFVFLFLALVGLVKSGLGERYRMPGVADLALLLGL